MFIYRGKITHSKREYCKRIVRIKDFNLYFCREIMRALFIYFLIIFSVFSCKNEDKKTYTTEPKSELTAQEKTLQQDIIKYPDSTMAVESLAKYYDSVGDYEAGLSVINKLIQKDSSNAHFYDVQGWLYYEKDDTLNAIHSYEKAIKLYPDPQYVITLGALYAGKKDAQALRMADALLEAPKANAVKEAYFIKGLYYNRTGDKNKAIAFFDKCLAQSYTFVNAYLEKGYALTDLGKYAEAVKVLDKGIAVQINFPDAYFAKGKALEKLNKKADAIEAYKMALLYDGSFTDAQEAINQLQK